MRSKSVMLVVLLIVASLAIFGCSDDTSKAVTNPGAFNMNPIGSIQGRLLDAVTLEPIVNAVIDIGVTQAVTTADGQFVLYNVPADTDALNGTVGGTYFITINMQNVTSPVNMNSQTEVYYYAKHYYQAVAVNYTSLDDTEAATSANPGGGSGTNHDTPVDQLMAHVDLRAGKLSTTINTVVAGCAIDESTGVLGNAFFQDMGAGYTVALVAGAATGNYNDTTGVAGLNVIGTATSDSNGEATFTLVEAGANMLTMAFDADERGFSTSDGGVGTCNRLTGAGCAEIATGGDGTVYTQSIQESTAIHVCPVDNHGPSIVNVTPEPGTDNTPGSTSVVFTFSEPVKQDASTTTDASSIGNLYEDIQVMYAGNKAGNVAYGLSWNATFDALTVTLTTAASGKYWVMIPGVDGRFTDNQGQAADRGVCPDDSDAPGAYAVPATGADQDCTVWFTTSGAAAADSPANIVITNANTLDETGTAIVDWLASAGAKKYNIYVTPIQWPGLPEENRHQTYLFDTTANTDIAVCGDPDAGGAAGVCDNAADDFNFVEGDSIQLAYEITVCGVDADEVESATCSAAAVAQDVVDPTMVVTQADFVTDRNDTLDVTYSNHMVEGVAETAANYTITTRAGYTSPTITAIQYVNKVATITFDNVESSLTSGPNGICDEAGTIPLLGDDTQSIPDGQGQANALCISPGVNGTLDTAPAGDDVATATTIGAGPDGVCDTAQAGDDVQVVLVGNGTPYSKCILEGTDTQLENYAVGGNDDGVLSALRELTIGSAVTDIAGNSIDPTTDHVEFDTTTGFLID